MVQVSGSSDVLLKGIRGYRIDPLYVTPDHFLPFVVPEGYEYDGASIPPILWGIIGHPFQLGFRRAAAAHDYMMIERNIPRISAQKIFYNMLLLDRVPKWRAYAMYFAVVIYWWFKDGWSKIRPD